MSPTPNHCHMDHSSVLLLLICKFQQWETWLPPSAICLLYYSISLYMYINIRFVNQYLHGTQPYQLGYSDYVPACLPLCLHTPHISKDTQVSTFSPILSLRQLHLFTTQLDSPVSLHSFLGFLHLLNDFNIYIH